MAKWGGAPCKCDRVGTDGRGSVSPGETQETFGAQLRHGLVAGRLVVFIKVSHPCD